MIPLFRRSLLLFAAAAAMVLISGCSEDTAECKAPNLMCGESCVSVQVDADNCGSCGNACGGNFVCSEGACVCPSGQTDCDGRCVDLRTDSLHCGACSNACESGSFCSESSCEEGSCPHEICDDVCTDTDADELNCGGCGVTCGGGEHCLAGVCTRGDLYAACFSSGQIVPFLKASGERSGTVADGLGGPQSLALLGDDQLVAVGNLDDTLYVFDRATMELVGSILLGEEPGLGPNQVLIRDQRAIVINSNVATIQVVDLSDPAAPASLYEVSVGEDTMPSMAAFDDAGTLWVSLNIPNQLIPVELGSSSGTAGEPIDLEHAEGEQPFPAGVVAVNNMIYVVLNNLDLGYAPAGNGRLATYDLVEKTTGLIDLGEGCTNPATARVEGDRLVVSCAGAFAADDGAIAFLDTTTKEIETIPTGGAPTRLSLDPSRPGFLFASDSGGGSFIAVDDKQEVRTIEACPPEAEWEFVGDVLVAP